VWRENLDLNCGRCGDRQDRKDANGCTGPAKRAYTRGHPKKIPVKFWRCPVRYIGTDVIALANVYNSAGGNLSVTERRALPPPYLEAWDMYRAEHRAAKLDAQERIAKQGAKG